MKKILLIEDNDDVRNNTAEILTLSNYEVIVAEDGKVGVEKALEYFPDLVICDITMPKLDGYGVFHAVHKNECLKNIPFIFLTARAERSDFRKGMELGVDDYITKPFNGTELLNAVDSRLKKMEQIKQELAPGMERLNHLTRFSGGKNPLQPLIDGRSVNTFKRKQIIYSEGNHPNRLYFVLTGKVRAYRIHEDGKELATELYCSGDFLGHIALLQGTAYTDTAEALEDTDIVVIPKEDFEELIHKDAAIASKFIQLMAKNIAEKENKLIGIAYNSLRKKVAEALLILMKKYQENDEKKFVTNISRENLASIAGTATESIIRTLSDFRSERLIDLNGRNIIILDGKKLESLIN